MKQVGFEIGDDQAFGKAVKDGLELDFPFPEASSARWRAVTSRITRVVIAPNDDCRVDTEISALNREPSWRASSISVTPALRRGASAAFRSGRIRSMLFPTTSASG